MSDVGSELELVSSEDLFAELARRFDGLILVSEKNVTDGECETFYTFNGGLSRAIGMCERAKARMMRMAERAADGEGKPSL